MRYIVIIALLMAGCTSNRGEADAGPQSVRVLRTGGFGGSSADILITRTGTGYYVSCSNFDAQESRISAHLNGDDYKAIGALFATMDGEWTSRGKLTIGRLMVDGGYITINAAGTEVTLYPSDEVPDYLDDDEKRLMAIINDIDWVTDQAGLNLW